MELKYILFEKKDHVAYITLNRPEKRNPINVDVAPELMYCFDESDYDDDIRMVVIRGAGGNFCGGGDLGAMKYRIDNNIRGTRQACRALDRKSTRLNSSHGYISYAVFFLKKKKKKGAYFLVFRLHVYCGLNCVARAV